MLLSLSSIFSLIEPTALLAQTYHCGQKDPSPYSKILSCAQVLDLQKNDPLQNIDSSTREKTVSRFWIKESCHFAYLNLYTNPTDFCLITQNEVKCQQPKTKEDLKTVRPIPWEALSAHVQKTGLTQSLDNVQNELLNRFLGDFAIDAGHRLDRHLARILNPLVRCNTLRWAQEKISSQCAGLTPDLDQFIDGLQSRYRDKCVVAKPQSTPHVNERQRSFLDGR